MIGRPPKEVLGLDMPFGEVMERFIGVKPREMEANVARSKKKKPLGSKKKRAPPSAKVKSQNVVSLKDRKTSLRRRGLA
jgi:hypothetical protein